MEGFVVQPLTFVIFAILLAQMDHYVRCIFAPRKYGLEQWRWLIMRCKIPLGHMRPSGIRVARQIHWSVMTETLS